jgi:hypothetical protein
MKLLNVYNSPGIVTSRSCSLDKVRRNTYRIMVREAFKTRHLDDMTLNDDMKLILKK